MESNNNIDQAFFPVHLCRLYWGEVAVHKDGIRQEGSSPVEKVLCPRHFAVVNMEYGYVYRCVTDLYELVTNLEAVNVAEPIAKSVFRKETMLDFKNKNVSFWGMHAAQCNMTFWDEDDFIGTIDNDKWIPFVQIGNSYNSTAPLSYELGFRICNSDIQITFDEISIEVKDSHTKGILRTLPEQLKKSIEQKKLYDIDIFKREFIRKMNTLYNAYIGEKDILPLALKLFGWDFYKDENNKEKCSQLHSAIKYCFKGSVKVFGNNMYFFIRMMAEIITQRFGLISRLPQMQRYESMIGKLINDLDYYLSTRKPSDTLNVFIGEKYYKMANDIVAYRSKIYWLPPRV